MYNSASSSVNRLISIVAELSYVPLDTKRTVVVPQAINSGCLATTKKKKLIQGNYFKSWRPLFNRPHGDKSLTFSLL